MRAPRKLTFGVVAVGVVGVVVLAGCSSNSGSSSAPTPAPVTVTATSTVTETATPTSSATATTAASTQCDSGDIKATVASGQAGAGQRQAVLVLTNTSDQTCTVTGYPGLQLVTSSGTKVPTKVVRVSTPAAKTVKVKPNGSASSTITFGVVPTGSEPNDGPCEVQASKIKVIPPNSTTSVTTAWTLGPVCNKGKISTNAFVAGSAG